MTAERPERDVSQRWYHGSQQRLTTLRSGSSISQKRAVARVFSHRPSLVSQEEDGTVKHDGTMPGYLYVVAEAIRAGDIYPHPHPVNAGGWEWLTTRQLSLMLVEQTQVRESERLTKDDLSELRRKQDAAGELTFVETPSTRILAIPVSLHAAVTAPTLSRESAD